MDELFPGWTEIHRSDDRRPCDERALVLRAVGIEYRIERPLGRSWHLLVPTIRVERATAELADWAEENTGRGERPVVLPPTPRGAWPAAAGYALVVLVVFLLERGRAFDLDWWVAGRGHSERLLDGEWWRAVTGLTLHADLSHLMSNVVFGVAFGVLLSQVLGSGVAWASIFATGVLGNALNAWFRGPGHLSIGASTATFGAVGVLVAYEWRRRAQMNLSPLRRWTPLLMGMVLLGWLGTGTPQIDRELLGDPGAGPLRRTDVSAHVSGMLTGVPLGALCGALLSLRGSPLPPGPRAQVLAGVAVIGIIALAWAAALLA